ncbi:Beige/BEACH domain containing protein, partial [Reticulomyxa filosa]
STKKNDSGKNDFRTNTEHSSGDNINKITFAEKATKQKIGMTMKIQDTEWNEAWEINDKESDKYTRKRTQHKMAQGNASNYNTSKEVPQRKNKHRKNNTRQKVIKVIKEKNNNDEMEIWYMISENEINTLMESRKYNYQEQLKIRTNSVRLVQAKENLEFQKKTEAIEEEKEKNEIINKYKGILSQNINEIKEKYKINREANEQITSKMQ